MVNLSMLGYIATALHRFQHPIPTQKEYSPHKYDPPKYSKQPKLALAVDDSELLPDDEKKKIQQILGTLLFYACAVDPTMLTAINSITRQQANPPINTAMAITHLLNYAAMYPDAMI
eukprot:15366114-Ditylum_brightwellii.AAC.2